MKALATFLLFSVFVTLSFSQIATLRGKIVDRNTGEPLELATVRLGDSTGTLTKADGSFRIKIVPGSYQLRISYTGYETYEKKVKLDSGEVKKLKVRMVETGSLMRTVVISSSQYAKNLEEEVVTMEVIDEELMKNINATELGEAVDKSVGVQVQEGQISIRGGSSYSYGVGSRTAVLVDNMGFASGDLGEAQLKFAPIENAEQIEVIKGASSVVYGSSALNGVVNVLTKWPGREPKTEITLFTGAWGPPKRREWQWWEKNTVPNFGGGYFNHSRKIGNMDFTAGGNLNRVNSFLWDGNEYRVRGNFKTRYHSQKNPGLTFGLNGNMMFENSGRFFLALDVDTAGYYPAESGSDRYLRTNIDPHFTFVTDKGASHRVLGRYMNVFRIAGDSLTVNANTNLYSLDYQFQQTLELKDSSRVIVTAGAPVSLGVSVSNLYPGRRITSSGAGYVQGEFKRDRLSVIGGVRYEYNSVDTVIVATIPVFRTGLNYRVGKATFLRSSWGQAYRLPSVGERFITEDFYTLKIFPNPDLLPEKGWGFEAGVKQGIRINKWQGFFDFNVFLNEYDNFVEYRLGFYPPPGQNIGLDDLGLKPQNVEEARVAGFETSIFGKGKIGDFEFRTLSGYTYNYPGNLQSDTAQRNLGVFLQNAANGIFNRLGDPPPTDYNPINDTSQTSLLNYRNRHLIKGDVEVFYKDFSLGYALYYASFPERIENLYYLAIPSLLPFVQNNQDGDWVHGLRASWTWTDHEKQKDKMKVSFIVKNLTNHVYALRPARFEGPVNMTLQLRFFL